MNSDLIASSIGTSVEDCKKSKQYFSLISKKLLKAIFNVPKKRKLEEYIEEFAKADVSIKTIRVNKENLPEEHVSFPAFLYKEIINQSWHHSYF